MTESGSFAERLLAWWDVHGRKNLPWQHPRTPYRVWVSEVMLQQTQVATVIPYFERWMRRFPDLAALANAPLDDVLGHWAGLGYYARARNLQRAAVLCRDEHQGELPTTAEGLASLPGIGESTANAIISQAFDTPLAILDGNAKRVLARHAAISGWPGQSAVLKALWQAAEDRLPPGRGADYTQAIMDLGATLCRRSQARCSDCPVSGDCRALADGLVDELPGRKPRKAVPEQALHWLVWQRRDDAVLLERRPSTGIWGGLWSLPEADSAQGLLQRFELPGNAVQPLDERAHRLTHRLFKIRPWRVDRSLEPMLPEGDLAWFTPGQWPALGLPKPAAQALSELERTP